MSHYPRLLRRIRGAMIDGVVIPVAVMGALVGLSTAGIETATPKIIAAIALILLLEPVAVATTGGTVGHHLTGIRVCRMDEQRNLGLFAAFVRFVVKSLFGLPSFLMLLATRRRQALHDVAARSVVIFREPSQVPEYEKLMGLTTEAESRAHASIWRRFGFIVLYWFLAAIGVSLFLDFLLAGQCLQRGVCTGFDARLINGSYLVLFFLWAAIAFMGWRGSLPGCRRARAASA